MKLLNVYSIIKSTKISNKILIILLFTLAFFISFFLFINGIILKPKNDNKTSSVAWKSSSVSSAKKSIPKQEVNIPEWFKSKNLVVSAISSDGKCIGEFNFAMFKEIPAPFLTLPGHEKCFAYGFDFNTGKPFCLIHKAKEVFLKQGLINTSENVLISDGMYYNGKVLAYITSDKQRLYTYDYNNDCMERLPDEIASGVCKIWNNKYSRFFVYQKVTENGINSFGERYTNFTDEIFCFDIDTKETIVINKNKSGDLLGKISKICNVGRVTEDLDPDIGWKINFTSDCRFAVYETDLSPSEYTFNYFNTKFCNLNYNIFDLKEKTCNSFFGIKLGISKDSKYVFYQFMDKYYAFDLISKETYEIYSSDLIYNKDYNSSITNSNTVKENPSSQVLPEPIIAYGNNNGDIYTVKRQEIFDENKSTTAYYSVNIMNNNKNRSSVFNEPVNTYAVDQNGNYIYCYSHEESVRNIIRVISVETGEIIEVPVPSEVISDISSRTSNYTKKRVLYQLYVSEDGSMVSLTYSIDI